MSCHGPADTPMTRQELFLTFGRSLLLAQLKIVPREHDPASRSPPVGK
jgi:hypothetical protein